jgi:hypothetical protein
MNAERIITRACRFYRAVLLLYPRAHRAGYGRLMEQLFRDQCRAALRETGGRGVAAITARALCDAISSAFREHITQFTQTMHTQTPSRIALILLVSALAFLQFAANSATHSTALTAVFLTLSALALLGRAVAECYRPSSEWLRGLAWGFVVALLYSLIFPAWKKYSDNLGLASLGWIKLSTVGVLLNFVVPIVKAVMTFFRRRAA